MLVSQSRATVLTDHLRQKRRFPEEIFPCRRRAEQRRWTRIYVSGLIRGNDRRTPRGPARAQRLPTAAANGLHHVINASPWDSGRVRRGPAPRIAGSIVNPQRSLGFFLVTGAGGVRAGWRLVLRGGWEPDTERRHRARSPEAKSGRPVGDYVRGYADQVAAAGLPDVPSMLELTRCEDAAEVLTGPRRRRLHFACEVGPRRLVVTGEPGSSTGIMVGERMDPRGGRRSDRPVRPAGTGQANGAPIYGASVRLPLFGTLSAGGSGTVRVLGLPDTNRQRPARYWITSCMTGRVGNVLPLVRARNAALAAVAELQKHVGALDFEGRSFPGPRHHMTMASAAYACRSLPGGDGRAATARAIRGTDRNHLLTEDLGR